MWKGGIRGVLSAGFDGRQAVDQEMVDHVYWVLRAETEEISQAGSTENGEQSGAQDQPFDGGEVDRSVP